MKVRLAKTAGFCMGVRLAMEKVLAEANKAEGPIYTYGPLIHNSQVMKLLESKGVKAVEDLEGLQEGTVVIRAHGIPPDKRALLKSTGMRVIDATCPRVARVQAIIRSLTAKGYSALIVGEHDHPEVIGLQGYAEGRAQVIDRPDQVAGLSLEGPLFVVAQTTQDAQVYARIVEEVLKVNPEAEVFDTICDATHNRQAEAASLAGQVDAMVVVGGYHSGNTRRLAQVSRSSGRPTFHVETEKELDRAALEGMSTVGVTAGASTPNWMIKNVVRELEEIRSGPDFRLVRAARGAVKFLVFTNILAASGAFSLAHAAALVSGRPPSPSHYALGAVYIWAMHILNRFLDRGASAYNEPDRAGFYKTYRIPLVLLGSAAQAAALWLGWTLGPAVLAAVAALSALGLVYSLPVVPTRKESRWRYRKIKDVPGSKTICESLAWSVVICLVPLLGPETAPSLATAVCFFFVLCVVYIRSALFDVFHAQGDLLVGAETLPVTIGEKRTLKLLKRIIVLGVLILVFAGLFHITTSFSFFLIFVFVSSYLTLFAYQRRWLYPGLRLEAMVEGSLLAAGGLGLAWQAWA